jgi:peroxiredoxin
LPVSAANRTAQLGYGYDKYEQPPKPGSTPGPTAVAQASPVDGSDNAQVVEVKLRGPAPAPSFTLPDGFGKTISLDQYKGRNLVVMFYEGAGCIRCQEQLNNFATRVKEFAELGIELVAIGIDAPEDLKTAQASYQSEGGFAFPLLSDAKLDVFKAYGCFTSDSQPLHGTFLIDAQGRVRWRDISDKPFNDPAYLLGEGKQLSRVAAAR